MKNPKNPVWVIYAENHYSVLFAASRDSLAPRGRKAFDAYYCKKQRIEKRKEKGQEIKERTHPPARPASFNANLRIAAAASLR